MGALDELFTKTYGGDPNLLALSVVHEYEKHTKSGKLVLIHQHTNTVQAAHQIAQQGGTMSSTIGALHAAHAGHALESHFRGDYISGDQNYQSAKSGPGTNNKFYESAVIKHPDGTATHSTIYGRRDGGNSQTQTTHHKTLASAMSAHQQKVSQKKAKGYYDDQYDQVSRNTNLVHHFDQARAAHDAHTGVDTSHPDEGPKSVSQATDAANTKKAAYLAYLAPGALMKNRLSMSPDADKGGIFDGMKKHSSEKLGPPKDADASKLIEAGKTVGGGKLEESEVHDHLQAQIGRKPTIDEFQAHVKKVAAAGVRVPDSFGKTKPRKEVMDAAGSHGTATVKKPPSKSRKMGLSAEGDEGDSAISFLKQKLELSRGPGH
jgi:predicted DNA-binding WGR domain protein